MKFLNTNKNLEDLFVLEKICFDVLCENLVQKENSDQFCGIYIDGRDRSIDCAEDWAAIKSFKTFSEFNYPVLVLSPNSNILDNIVNLDWRIKHIEIPILDSHDKYIEFCCKSLFNYIEEKYENLLFFQSDGFLMKSGWEEYVLSDKFDYIGSAWRHYPGIDIFDNNQWKELPFPRINVGNGGFSFRKRSACQRISAQFGNYILRERFREDNRPPPEDLFYSNILNGLGYKVANEQQANVFSVDPLSFEDYIKKVSFGFHYPVQKKIKIYITNEQFKNTN